MTGTAPCGAAPMLALGNLHEIQFHRGLSSEDGNGHAQLALFVVDIVHDAIEALEGALDNPNVVAAFEVELGPGVSWRLSISERMRAASLSLMGVGRFFPPTKPVTLGMDCTRWQERSVIIMRIIT